MKIFLIPTICSLVVCSLLGGIVYFIQPEKMEGATSVISVYQGGTSTSTDLGLFAAQPTFGDVLMGSTSGKFYLVPTSTLNIIGSRWTLTGDNISYTNGNVSIGTTTSMAALTVQGDIATINNEFYFNSSTGRTQIIALDTGNLNFPDNAGRVGFGNMVVSTTVGQQMEIGLGGFNGDYPISIYAESLAGYGYATRTLWINFNGYASYCNASSTGCGESKGFDVLVTYTTVTGTLYKFTINPTTTQMVHVEVVGTNQVTGTTTQWTADIIHQRWNNVLTLKNITVLVDYRDNPLTAVFTSTTPTGFDLNVVGDTTTTWKLDKEVHNIEP